MPPSRPRISPTVLRELARKVHQDDPNSQQQFGIHPALALLQRWSLVLIGGAWCALIVVAPLLLVLLPFGLNYTVQWLIVAAWLLSVSFVVISLFLISEWLNQRFRGGQPRNSLLLAGVALLVITVSMTFLFWQGSDDISPVVLIGLSSMLGLIFVGYGVYRLITERQTALVFRLLFLLAMLCFAIGLVTSGMLVKQDALGIAPEIERTLQTFNTMLMPISWVALLLSKLGRARAEAFRWNRRTLVLLVAVIVLIGLFTFIRAVR